MIKSNHEHIGDVVKVIDEGGYIKVVFSIQTALELPTDAIPKEVLQDLVGKRIGVICIAGKYYLRIISPDVKTNKIIKKGVKNELNKRKQNAVSKTA